MSGIHGEEKKNQPTKQDDSHSQHILGSWRVLNIVECIGTGRSSHCELIRWRAAGCTPPTPDCVCMCFFFNLLTSLLCFLQHRFDWLIWNRVHHMQCCCICNKSAICCMFKLLSFLLFRPPPTELYPTLPFTYRQSTHVQCRACRHQMPLRICVCARLSLRLFGH